MSTVKWDAYQLETSRPKLKLVEIAKRNATAKGGAQHVTLLASHTSVPTQNCCSYRTSDGLYEGTHHNKRPDPAYCASLRLVMAMVGLDCHFRQAPELSAFGL